MFFTIRNDDELCCARAIVTAKAKLDSDPNWNNVRLGRTIQGDLATQLHEKAKVQCGICGIPEIKKFQDVLPGHQIVLIFILNLNFIFIIIFVTCKLIIMSTCFVFIACGFLCRRLMGLVDA